MDGLVYQIRPSHTNLQFANRYFGASGVGAGAAGAASTGLGASTGIVACLSAIVGASVVL